MRVIRHVNATFFRQAKESGCSIPPPLRADFMAAAIEPVSRALHIRHVNEKAILETENSVQPLGEKYETVSATACGSPLLVADSLIK